MQGRINATNYFMYTKGGRWTGVAPSLSSENRVNIVFFPEGRDTANPLQLLELQALCP